MKSSRIEKHPILAPLELPLISFTFNGKKLQALEGEVITSALYAAGITILGHHHRDKAPQGIFCANGQCSQCIVIADGKPVKACMAPVHEGMQIQSCEGLPPLGKDDEDRPFNAPSELAVKVLIVGGGPAGLSAAIELGQAGIDTLIVDDKNALGGKLTLQTHFFFGSVQGCWAGTRGIDIATLLSDKIKKFPSVKVWLSSPAVGVYGDKKVGIVNNGRHYLVTPEIVLVASGAREKSLVFPGCDLPGVYGAGAFQTLVNRDRVLAAKRLFIVGGGNVGLIGAYHALQAGIDVVGLVEALPKCGGYKVHEDKIKRLGVPIWTSHTVIRAEGKETLERVITSQIDSKFRPIPGTEKVFDVDTLLIAVGLSPVNELYTKSKEYGMKVYAAGDAEEIAEASAAIFSGRVVGRKIVKDLGYPTSIPPEWEEQATILRSRPGKAFPYTIQDLDKPVYPIIRCVQEIPCNPCTELCPRHLIHEESIMATPTFAGECLGCGRCVANCPGLAITLLCNDYDPTKEKVLIMLPFEFKEEDIPLGKEVITVDWDGEEVGRGKVIAVRERQEQDRCRLLLLEVPQRDKLKVAGFRIRDKEELQTPQATDQEGEDDPLICRCGRVRKSEIIKEIRKGVKDINQLKAITRIGMGGCGGKTCVDLVLSLYKGEGIPVSEVNMPTNRPLVMEVPLDAFISPKPKEDK